MRCLLARTAAGVLSLAAAGCLAPITVGSFVQPRTDFTEYRTFAWDDVVPVAASDARFARNPIFIDHMSGAVERQLVVRGIELNDPSERPDLLVRYYTTITERVETVRSTGSNGVCPLATCPDAVVEFEQSTLVLDVRDARTGQLVWRGWAEERLDDLLASADALAREVDRSVALMFARFPRPARRSVPRTLPAGGDE